MKHREGVLSEYVKMSQLVIDPRIQRSYDERHAQHIADNFDWAKFGTVVVSARRDGSMNVLNGQHRIGGARAAGYNGSTLIPCEVHHGLSLDQEADLFLGHNDFRGLTPIQKFLVALTAERPTECEINKICMSLGVQIKDSSGDYATPAVTALRRIYAYSPDCLRETLVVIIDAWGGSRDSLQGDIMAGVGLFLHQYGWRTANGPKAKDKVDTDSLSHKLAALKGGPLGLKGRGKINAEIEGSTIANGVAAALVTEYNRNRRPENRLAPWRR